jgi:hypothetical protein
MSPRKRRKIRRTSFQRQSRQRQPGDAHTILSFCASNQISESLYFALKRKGKGPREINLGGRTIITPEAERDWRIEREAETMAKRQQAVAAGTTAAAA